MVMEIMAVPYKPFPHSVTRFIPLEVGHERPGSGANPELPQSMPMGYQHR